MQQRHPVGHRTAVLSREVEPAARPGRPREPRIGGCQWTVERLGERNVTSIVRTHVRAEFPDAAQERPGRIRRLRGLQVECALRLLDEHVVRTTSLPEKLE